MLVRRARQLLHRVLLQRVGHVSDDIVGDVPCGDRCRSLPACSFLFIQTLLGAVFGQCTPGRGRNHLSGLHFDILFVLLEQGLLLVDLFLRGYRSLEFLFTLLMDLLARLEVL